MNTNEIAVTADGYVHVGRNEWASLEEIQRAVEAKQNSALVNNEGNDGKMEHRVKPELNVLQPQCGEWSESRVLSLLQECAKQEALEHPSTLVRNVEVKYEAASHSDNKDHLPLPSTFRKVEDHRKQAQPTVNRDCPTCQEHLIPLSTMQKKRAAS